MTATPTPMPGWLSVFAALMTAVGSMGLVGGLSGLLLVRRQGRKVSADTTSVLTTAAVALVAPLEQRLGAAETQLRTTQARLWALERRLDALISAVLDPAATLDSLRVLARNVAGRQTGGNGDG